MESSPSTMDTNRENSPASPFLEKESFTDIMMKRWNKHVEKTLNKTDMNDAKKVHSESGQPEYAQSNYLMLRQQEESHRIGNYFSCATNAAYSNFLKSSDSSRIITRSQRSLAVYLMIELNLKRSYEIDTLFMAVNVMDRYLAMAGHWNVRPEDLDTLACSCLLIAAKLEQPQVPNYQNMIYAYDDLKGQEQSTMTKADIKAMEEKVLVQLGFDFNFSSPRHFLDRYIRILDEHICSEETKTLALQILVLQQVNEKMLAYSGSQVAAASLILAINQQNMSDLMKNIEKGKPSE
jgi:hypothetical protein